MKTWGAEDWFLFFIGLALAVAVVSFSVCMVADCLVNYCHLRLW
jgi:hypothetical protein